MSSRRARSIDAAGTSLQPRQAP